MLEKIKSLRPVLKRVATTIFGGTAVAFIVMGIIYFVTAVIGFHVPASMFILFFTLTANGYAATISDIARYAPLYGLTAICLTGSVIFMPASVIKKWVVVLLAVCFIVAAIVRINTYLNGAIELVEIVVWMACCVAVDRRRLFIRKRTSTANTVEH